ncbi:MAG: hypothetical protein ACPL6D_06630 [Thermodesulfobacteriota bacterium]
MTKKMDESRNRMILEIVREFLLSELGFQEIFKKYKEGRLRFQDIGNWVDDKGQSLLYNLKENCHKTFRYSNMVSSQKKEWLLDLAIGSIFHEAMKIRENLYQLEVYRPKYLQYKLKAGKTDYEKNYLKQFERIISRAEQGLSEGMEETHSLFRDATAQLVDVLKENSKNIFLIRFLLENQPLLQKVYGLKRARAIIERMFKRGFLDAYLLVAHSYLKSEHYDLASFYFSKALKMAPRQSELLFLYCFCLGMKAYYNNAYSKALSCFEKLLSIKSKRKKDDLKKVEEVCQRMTNEMEDEKDLRIFHRITYLVERIKRYYN